MRGINRALAVMFSAGALVLAIAPVASAQTVAKAAPRAKAARGGHCVKTNEPKPHGGKACFKPDGDHFRVCDIEVDQRHAIGKLYVKRDGTWKLKKTLEDDRDAKCTDAGDDLNVTEKTVKIKVCLQNGQDPPNTNCHSRRVTQ